MIHRHTQTLLPLVKYSCFKKSTITLLQSKSVILKIIPYPCIVSHVQHIYFAIFMCKELHTYSAENTKLSERSLPTRCL
jgi:hypothetical protein